MNKLPQKSLIGRVYENIIKNGLIQRGETVGVAVSGGADSVCLLEILLTLSDKLGIKIIACHFNHRLRGQESGIDQKFVQEFCKERDIKCLVGEADQKNILKDENSARKARYDFFIQILEQGRVDKIALAHNQNDFVETAIFRLVRGSGISGLKSIPLKREKFIRPLLVISRKEIEKYLVDHNLGWRNDSSNNDLKYQRNRIRHQILPLLSSLNPNLLETVTLASQNIENDYDFLEQQARKEFEKIVINKETDQLSLDFRHWQSLHPAMQSLVLRLAIADFSSLLDITAKQLFEVIRMLNHGIGKKHKLLPHSLHIELRDGKIILFNE